MISLNSIGNLKSNALIELLYLNKRTKFKNYLIITGILDLIDISWYFNFFSHS